ncbi:putative RNA-directed DNA polymerase from transposon X-element [Frankliniella fusca]|uniref:RNA-directed DNA polymerase from transposon X-element n=1 Tax=Frankliniella fusca TaxID=407009 RepID=A0AAE1HYG1_9NEOP|nr:putative RNA-directed DNA polymerase from transposon X-element [Frankliniella fusca]
MKLLEEKNPGIAVFTEHWLSEDEMEEFTIPNYTKVSHFSRKRSRGGGVLILKRNNIDCKVQKWKDIEDTNDEDLIEAAAIEIKIQEKEIKIIGLYRTPTLSKGKTKIRQIEDFEEKLQDILLKIKNGNACIIGDFNIDFLENSREKKLIVNLLSSSGYYQLINEGTRQGAKKISCIDNVFVNSNTKDWRSEVKEECLSDHKLQIIEWDIKTEKKEGITVNRRSTNAENLWTLKQLLEREDWTELYQEKDVNKAWNIFIETFKYNLEIACPKKKKKLNGKTKKIEWNKEIDEVRERIIWQKECLRKNIGNKDALKTKIKKNRTLIKKLYNKSMRKHYRDMMEEANDNPKDIWRVINVATGKNKNANSDDNISINKNGKVYSRPEEVAEIFNQYYVNVPLNIAKGLKKVELDMDLINNIDKTIYVNPCTPQTIRRIIQKLRNKKSAGIDEISNEMLKTCVNEIQEPVCYLTNLIIENEEYPDQLKITKIKPLFKKKDKSLTENYRPVALVPCLSRVTETVILENIKSFVQKHQIIEECQFGYQERKSTSEAICSLLEQIDMAKKKRKKVMAIFLDLSKAFDCVQHESLLNIMEKYGIRGKMGNIVQSYLKDRKQYVEIERIEEGRIISGKSNINGLECSVPQGSVFGPYMFILYTNAIKKIVSKYNANAIVYVDDTNIIIEEDSSEELERKAKKIINELYDYFSALNLQLNLSKSIYMLFDDNEDFELNIEQCTLERVVTTRFLGVDISENLKWNDHCLNLLRKLNRGLFSIQLVHKYLDRKSLKKIYYANVHSYLQYGIEIWGDERTNKKHINKIFKKQKRAIRMIYFKKLQHVSCRGIFKSLGILTLTSMYILKMALLAKKFHQGNKNSAVHNYMTRKREDLHYRDGKSRTPLKRSIPIFNRLPHNLKEISEERSFKKNLKKWLIEKEFYSLQDFLN